MQLCLLKKKKKNWLLSAIKIKIKWAPTTFEFLALMQLYNKKKNAFCLWKTAQRELRTGDFCVCELCTVGR